MTGVIGLCRSIVFSVDVCVCCAVFNTRALRDTNTMACDNCEWTTLDFSFMCRNVTTSAVVSGTCLLFLSSVVDTSKVSYVL